MSSNLPATDLQKLCASLSDQNKRYVLAVASALKFAQDSTASKAPAPQTPEPPSNLR